LKPPLAITALVLLYPSTSRADECMATLEDSQASAHVVSDECMATIKAGEHFLAAPAPNGWNVYLRSGCNGYIDKVKLHLLPDEPLMKLNYDQQRKRWRKWRSAPEPGMGEAASSAKARGVNYYKVLTAASDGDFKAMARFFSMCASMDGAAAEGCFGNGWELFHIVGDESFAKFLTGQPMQLQKEIAGILSSADTEPISKPEPYIRRYFPRSYKILLARNNHLGSSGLRSTWYHLINVRECWLPVYK
jgi:hypothetical protein